MTFEEFFTKKRIDLVAFEKGEPALFFEFRAHFNQMGEKSFDHTKKYWFNNLRKVYHLAPGIKSEKVKIENPLAEQTITEALTEAASPAPKLGFTPKFKAPVAAKPTEETLGAEKNEDTPTAPKPGFTPRFKAANMAKPAQPTPETEENKEETPGVIAPKLGFTPKFKAANMAKPAEEKKEDAPAPIPEAPQEDTPVAAPKLGFKPKFKPSGPSKPEGE